MAKPSEMQLDTLRRMAALDGTVRRLDGGFWVSNQRILSNGWPAERSCDIRTIRGLEKRGWVERTNTFPEEWRDVRRITDTGRELAKGASDERG